MHKLITAALLATTIASPLMAQEHPGNRGPGAAPYERTARDQDRGREPRQGDRPDAPRQGQPGAGYERRPGPPPQGGGRPDFQRRSGDDRGFARAPAPGRGPDQRPGANRGPDRRSGAAREPDRRPGGDRGPDHWQGRGPDRGQPWRGGDRGPDRRPPPGGWQDGRDRGAGDQRGWDQRWRSDQRYDWRGYRAGHRDAFEVPGYYAPGGYGYRRFEPGYQIGSQFYDRRYWILDPYEYRLPPAYGAYRWVRYFDDVLLIDLRSGLVVDAIPGFFY